MLARLHRDESGIALITALLVGMVVLSLGLVTVQLSTHNAGQSALDRKRVQAIHAAEAGLDAYLSSLPRTPPPSLVCAGAVTSLPLDTGAQYQITAKFYPTFPGVQGQEIACPQSATAPPVGAVIVSKGTAVSVGNARAVSRTMQTEVRLNPIYGGFGPAIFSDVQFNVQNNLTVNGSNGNNGDLYTNGNFTCNNSSLDYGSVYAQGTATLGNSCTVQQDLWANGTISLSQSAHIGHDVTSSTSSISFANSSQADHNARAGTSCATCAGHVTGTITQNSPQAAPPAIQMPTINYVSSAWTAAGYTISTQSNCTSLANTLGSTGVTTKTVYRVTPACALSFNNNTTINMAADAAIITDGSFSTNNKTVFQSTDASQPRNLYIIVPRSLFTPSTPPDSRATNCGANNNLSLANNTDFINVKVFLYTPCTVNINNNNVGLGGQIFGQTVNINNQFSFTYQPLLVPGAGSITGFNPDIAYLREITNS